jgi:hypothetical protein
MRVQVFHHDFPSAPDALTHVADVELPDGTDTEAALEYAYRWTQNIGGSWSRGPTANGGHNPDFNQAVHRRAPLHEIDGKTYGLRSSMMGDVFEIVGGERWVCAMMGFERYTPKAVA